MDITTLAKMAQRLNPVNLTIRHKWIIRNANLNTIKKLWLTDIKKYWTHTCQVKRKVDWVHN